MSIYKKPNILYLRGIVSSDFEIDDSVFDKKFVEEIEESRLRAVNYKANPQTFTDWKSWPLTSNLKCWFCDRITGGVSIFITDDLSFAVDGSRIITTKGHFCTTNCAQAYINNWYTGAQRDDKTKYLLMLAREKTKENIFCIQPSPPKTIMRQYMGPDGISEEDYGKRIAILEMETRSYALGKKAV